MLVAPSSILRLMVVLTLITLGVALSIQRTGPRPGPLTEIVGLDDGSIAVFRTIENRPGLQLELATREGALLWSRSVPLTTRPQVTATDQTLIVRTAIGANGSSIAEESTPSTPHVMGLDIETGHLSWQRSPLSPLVSEQAFLGPWTWQLSDTRLVYEVYESLESWLLVIARDAANGQERWQYRSRRSVTALGPAWLVEGYLVLADLHAIRILDADNGQEIRRLPLLGSVPCRVGKEIYFTSAGQLRLLSLDNLEERAFDLSGELAEDEERYLRLHGLCGRHDDLVVLAFDRAVVALDTDNEELVWQLDIDEATFANITAGRDQRLRYPQSVPFSDELSRFVPVLMGAQEQTLLVMLDLEEGDIAWSSPHLAEADSAYLLKRGTLHYLVRMEPEPSIAVIDGSTGALVTTKQLGPFENASTGIAPHHFIGGDLVLFNAQQWVVVDGRTLEPVGSFAGTIELEDVRDATLR